jgi:hypothetical protein
MEKRTKERDFNFKKDIQVFMSPLAAFTFAELFRAVAPRPCPPSSDPNPADLFEKASHEGGILVFHDHECYHIAELPKGDRAVGVTMNRPMVRLHETIFRLAAGQGLFSEAPKPRLSSETLGRISRIADFYDRIARGLEVTDEEASIEMEGR